MSLLKKQALIIEEVTDHIKRVREGKGDFSSLIDQLQSQSSIKTKVVSAGAVNNARKLGHNLIQIT
jgi:hypothetical protein